MVTKMVEEGWSTMMLFGEAQRLGICKRSDEWRVDGIDAAYKDGCLSLPFGMKIAFDDVFTRELQYHTRRRTAQEFGYVVKLVVGSIGRNFFRYWRRSDSNLPT